MIHTSIASTSFRWCVRKILSSGRKGLLYWKSMSAQSFQTSGGWWGVAGVSLVHFMHWSDCVGPPHTLPRASTWAPAYNDGKSSTGRSQYALYKWQAGRLSVLSLASTFETCSKSRTQFSEQLLYRPWTENFFQEKKLPNGETMPYSQASLRRTFHTHAQKL